MDEFNLNELLNDPAVKAARADAAYQELGSANIITAYDVKFEALEWLRQKKTGYAIPWESMKDLFWLVKGEMTVISGYSGHGKSQFVSQIGLHCINQDASVLLNSFELSRGAIYGRIFTQATGISDPTDEYWNKYINFYNNRLFAYDLQGNAKVDEVLTNAQRAFDICGIDIFIFDNLMMLNDLVDDFAAQHSIVQKILTFTKKNKVVSILVAHSKKPMKGMPIPGMYDVSGSSNIVNMVDNHISITKNIQKIRAAEKLRNGLLLDDKETMYLDEPDAYAMRDKKREIGDNFLKGLFFDQSFNVFKDFESQRPINYLES